MKISPSRLVYVEACAKFKPSPFSGDAADEGIQLHEYMENMVQQPVDTWSEWIDGLMISESSKALLHTASDRIQPIATWTPDCYSGFSLTTSTATDGLAPGLYPELQVEIGRGKFGYIDLLISQGDGNYTIVDYKFVRAAGDFELQLAAYACAVAKLLGDSVTNINALIVAPYLPDDAEPMEWSFSKAKLNQYRQIIKKIEETTEDPNVDGKPGSHCERCAWSGKCRYQIARAEVATVSPMPAAIRRYVNPVTLQDRADRRDFMKCLESVVESFKEDDKKFFAENPEAELPGYKLTHMQGRLSLDTSRAAEINTALLSNLVGSLTVDDLVSLSIPDVTKLAEHVSLAEAIPVADAKRKVSAILDEFMKRGTPFVTLRKVGARSRITEN